MKRKIFFPAAMLLCLLLTLCSACSAAGSSSIKDVTRPYIAQYECVEARYGDADLLKNYDYIRIILTDKENMELDYKPKGEERKVFRGRYSLDPSTRELSGEIGVLGFKYREKVKIENGSFTITKPLGERQFTAKFRAQ